MTESTIRKRLQLPDFSVLQPRARPFSAVLSVLLAGLAVFSHPPSLAQDAPRADDAVPVRYAAARGGESHERLKAMGRVVASRSTVVAGEVAGAVERVYVRPGGRVQKGQKLARLRARPLELRLAAAQGELTEAQAHQRSGELRLERLRTLAGSEVVSTQTVDDSLYELQALEGRVARLRAAVEQLEDDLERTVLRAPFAGTVAEEKTQVGQWLDVGDPVVELISLDDLEVRLEIPADRYPNLEPGVTVVLRSESGAGAPIEGKLRAVVPRASERAHTFPAYVSLPPGADLAVGVLLRGELPLGSSRTGVWVPKDALVGSDGSHAVFAMSTDFVVRRVRVRAGRADGTWREIESVEGKPIRPGDFVVTHGNENLDNGRKVRAVPQEYPSR